MCIRDSHEVDSQIEFHESDLLTAITTNESEQFDFVVSNPPYVSELEYAELSSEVKEFEPRTALVGGAQGTEIIERLVPQAAVAIKPGGWLIIEISPMIAEAVRGLFTLDSGFSSCEIKTDHAGHLRTVVAQRAA